MSIRSQVRDLGVLPFVWAIGGRDLDSFFFAIGRDFSSSGLFLVVGLLVDEDDAGSARGGSSQGAEPLFLSGGSYRSQPLRLLSQRFLAFLSSTITVSNTSDGASDDCPSVALLFRPRRRRYQCPRRLPSVYHNYSVPPFGCQ